MYPNAYYNYRKHRRAKEAARKQTILRQIQAIYHETNGVAGYRRMQIHLARKGIHLSALTVHKYMNTELGLHSIVRRKAPRYQFVISLLDTYVPKMLDHNNPSSRGIYLCSC